MIDPRQLVGRKGDDPGDVLACVDRRYFVLPPGISPFDWESPGRLVPNPPAVGSGPFSEIRLARTPEAAWAAQVARRAATSEQAIWQVLGDLRRYAVYRLEAPGVRIKDCHEDGRFAGGILALRREGEDARAHGEARSREWQALDRCFQEAVVAVALPDRPPPPGIRLDWPLIASVPRLHQLGEDGRVRIVHVGPGGFGARELLRLTDLSGAPAGRRFLAFLARQLVRDFLSPRRPRGNRDRLAVSVALLTSLGAIAGLALRLVELLS